MEELHSLRRLLVAKRNIVRRDGVRSSKVTFALEEAMKTQKGRRGIALLFL